MQMGSSFQLKKFKFLQEKIWSNDLSKKFLDRDNGHTSFGKI